MTPIVVANFFIPYDFSPTVALLCLDFMVFYIRGLGQLSHHGNAPGRWRLTGFLVGLMYGSL